MDALTLDDYIKTLYTEQHNKITQQTIKNLKNPTNQIILKPLLKELNARRKYIRNLTDAVTNDRDLNAPDKNYIDEMNAIKESFKLEQNVSEVLDLNISLGNSIKTKIDKPVQQAELGDTSFFSIFAATREENKPVLYTIPDPIELFSESEYGDNNQFAIVNIFIKSVYYNVMKLYAYCLQNNIPVPNPYKCMAHQSFSSETDSPDFSIENDSDGLKKTDIKAICSNFLKKILKLSQFQTQEYKELLTKTNSHEYDVLTTKNNILKTYNVYKITLLKLIAIFPYVSDIKMLTYKFSNLKYAILSRPLNYSSFELFYSDDDTNYIINDQTINYEINSNVNDNNFIILISDDLLESIKKPLESSNQNSTS